MNKMKSKTDNAPKKLDAHTLFQASIAAFCCLSCPSPSDLHRLDALIMPIYGQVHRELKRQAAEQLAECFSLPPKITASLMSEELEIAAPILMAKAPLQEGAMLRCVARHGSSHLELLMKRDDLPSSLEALARSQTLVKRTKPKLENAVPVQVAALPEPVTAIEQISEPELKAPATVETFRASLRAIMAEKKATTQAVKQSTEPSAVAPEIEPKQVIPDESEPSTSTAPEAPIADDITDNQPITHSVDDAVFDFHGLVHYAVGGEKVLLATRIGDGLGLDHNQVLRMLAQRSYADILTCLRALKCNSPMAFAIIAPFYTDKLFASAAAVSLFYQRAEGLSVRDARARVKDWQRNETPLSASNLDILAEQRVAS